MPDQTSDTPDSDNLSSAADKTQHEGSRGAQSIKRKLTISLLIVYTISALSAYFALFSLARVEAKISIIESLDAISQKVLEARRYEKNYLLYDNPEDLHTALDYLDQVRTEVKDLRMVVSFPKKDLPEYEVRLEGYAEALKKLDVQKESSHQDRLEEAVHLSGHILTTYVLAQDNKLRE